MDASPLEVHRKKRKKKKILSPTLSDLEEKRIKNTLTQQLWSYPVITILYEKGYSGGDSTTGLQSEKEEKGKSQVRFVSFFFFSTPSNLFFNFFFSFNFPLFSLDPPHQVRNLLQSPSLWVNLFSFFYFFLRVTNVQISRNWIEKERSQMRRWQNRKDNLNLNS